MLTRPARTALLATVTAGLAALAVAAPAWAAPGDLALVSITAAGVPGDQDSEDSDVSADGRYVAFRSSASSLGPDANVLGDIFVKDMATGQITLVSRASDSAGGAPANLPSSEPSISDDGRHVAFHSDATNLDPGVTNAMNHVYVHDLQTGTTTLVDRRSSAAGGAVADADSSSAEISADGRSVVFESSADNLSAADDDNVRNVFVRDLVAQTTTLVSRRSEADGGAAADGDSRDPSISGDGGRVTFTSEADNLSAEDGPVDDIFVHDLTTRTTTLASRASDDAGGATGDDHSGDAFLSGDGRHVVFESLADNLSPGNSVNGWDIYRRDLQTGSTELVSRSSLADGDAPAADDATEPAVSADGRYVAFQSDADNLSGEDDDAHRNVFVRDIEARTTTLVSRQSPVDGGEAGDDDSSAAGISADGRYVTFASHSDNLSGLDADGESDVFRADVLGDPPTATATTGGAGAPVGAPMGTSSHSDLCAPGPATATPSPDSGKDAVALSVTQLRINQRISQAAIRRLNAVQAWLDAGVQGRDVCGGALGQGELTPGSTHEVVAAPLAAIPVAHPRPVTPEPASSKSGVTFTLTAAQFLINQRIDQAAVRRANALEARLASGLTGGDVEDGALTQGQLHDRLHVLAIPAGEAPASVTVIAPRVTPADPDSVEVSAGQLAINQRIAQAGVRRSNALIARLETGLRAQEFRDGSIGSADLAPGVIAGA